MMPSTGDQIGKGMNRMQAQIRHAPLLQLFAALLVTLFAGFGIFWYTSCKDIAARMEKRLPAFEESLETWTQSIDTWAESPDIRNGEPASTFSKANPDLSDSPRLPSRADVREIRENVTSLISSLNTVPTPTRGIENAAENFRQHLSDIIRETGRYDGTKEAFAEIVHASNEATKAGDAHNREIEDYSGSMVKRLPGAL